MNREIKFKILTDENKIIGPFDLSQNPIYWEGLEDGTRFLYTGLKDSKGNDIYEGHILSTDLQRQFLIVEFKNGAFMFNCNDGEKDYYDLMMSIVEKGDKLMYHEIIGNIYENRELLK